MRYSKPTIAALGSASVAIQTQSGVKGGNAPDAIENQMVRSTGTSYDLDE